MVTSLTNFVENKYKENLGPLHAIGESMKALVLPRDIPKSVPS